METDKWEWMEASKKKQQSVFILKYGFLSKSKRQVKCWYSFALNKHSEFVR